MVQPVDRPTSRAMLAALQAAGAKGTAFRRLDGRWAVQLWQLPPLAAEAREEWLAGMADHLEGVAGVRPEVETGD